MNANKRQKYFITGQVLVITMLLWHLLPAISYSQKGVEAETAGGEKPSGITMQTVSGKVVETMNSGGYTYALVDKDGAKTWVALPTSRISVGNEISCQPGMVMNNFRSTSLNRTFKSIVFSGGITSLTGTSVPPAETHSPDKATDLPKIKEPEQWKGF